MDLPLEFVSSVGARWLLGGLALQRARSLSTVIGPVVGSAGLYLPRLKLALKRSIRGDQQDANCGSVGLDISAL